MAAIAKVLSSLHELFFRAGEGPKRPENRPPSSVLLSAEDAKIVYNAARKEPTEQLKQDYAKFKHLL